jgi:G3E family GTPase
MKGILAVADNEQRFIFNAVRSALDVRPGKPWGTEPRESRIVFIGRGLDASKLQSEFDQFRLQ